MEQTMEGYAKKVTNKRPLPNRHFSVAMYHEQVHNMTQKLPKLINLKTCVRLNQYVKLMA